MSLSVKIPKEIHEYQEKIIFGLSLRQLLCCVVAIGLALAAYWLGCWGLGWNRELVEYLIIAQSIPLMALGFVKKNGWHFEKYLALWLRHQFQPHRYVPQTNLAFCDNQLLGSVKVNHVPTFFWQAKTSESQRFQPSRQQTQACRKLARASIKRASADFRQAVRQSKIVASAPAPIVPRFIELSPAV